MSCEHDCPKPLIFPAVIFNRPALDEIRYRSGDYNTMRDHLLDQLDKSRALQSWTHRGADDPGIAVLENAATVGEILAFYQNLYANEAFIRSAQWRESVASLVQLTGYRLAPGVGGEALFAFAVSGENPVTVPMGFAVKAQLEDKESPSIFESTHEVVAYPPLNQFSLFQPRASLQSIATGMTELELHAVDGKGDLASRSAFSIQPGDRIMLVPDSSMFDQGGGTVTSASAQEKPETLIVSEVKQVLDRILIRFEGSLTVNRGTTIRAYKVDRSFRHFGFNAPRYIVKYNETTGMATRELTVFEREIWGSHTFSGVNEEFYSDIFREEMPLEVEVDDLPVGGKIIIQGVAEVPSISGSVNFIVVREIAEVRADSMAWGGISAGSTVIKMTQRTIANTSVSLETADIRRISIHEIVSPELTLRAPTQWPTGGFTTSELNFYGTYRDALYLADRDLLLENPEGLLQSVRVMTTRDEFDLTGKDEKNLWLWPVLLDQLPEFPPELFSEENPEVKVYGNLVSTDQGETQKEVVLGSGDARLKFQTWPLPKSPLTYLLDPTHTPAQVPELEVYVDGILWERVENFFNSGPLDKHYVLREDEEETSYIQCGDGKTGARCPSGRNNIVALYRTGNSAFGPLEPEAKPKAKGKLKPLDEIFMPGPAVGGAERESEALAREAAPDRMQSLDRLVGLEDYEAEALALPGVLKTRADWAAPHGTPLMRIAVLTEGGDPAEVEKVRSSLQTANRCRGAARFSLWVVPAIRKFIYLKVNVGYRADRRAEDLEPQVLAALGVVGREGDGIEGDGGLFGLDHRQLGQGAHVSQVLAAAQLVEGVSWVRVEALQSIPLGSPPENDPDQLFVPVSALRMETIECSNDHILVLHNNHMDLSFSQDSSIEVCR